MMNVDRLSNLLFQHLQGELSPLEQEQLATWINESERNRRLFESIDDEEQLRRLVLLYEQDMAADNEAIILSKIRQQLPERRPAAAIRKLRWARIAAAAVVLLVLGTGGYFLLKKDEMPSAAKTETPTDIPPGRAGAILTLADGRKVVLDSLGNGVIATQNGTQVVLKNGSLAYANDPGTAVPVYNNLSTSRGRQFQVMLPDGTKVWLNAASSLKYPTAFNGSERRVAITGEVYFEVAKNEAQPFIVDINDQAHIQVLGTEFNINAYENEAAVKTTLVDGSLKFKSMDSVTLKPGQQAILTNNRLTTNKHADIDKATAWKRGIFNFEDASLEEVMRQVERWYDIDVVYEKGIPDIKFGGKLSNDVSLKGLLKSLQESEVHFRVEGRKVIVLP
jgi:transmembrane sensor